jgi:hypothetical protein
MGELVNLRRHRKRKERDAKEASAAESRVLYGRTRAEKTFDETRQRQAEDFLSMNRLERDRPDGADERD